MLLSDSQIRLLSAQNALVAPCLPELVRQVGKRKVISYGPSSYGYDCRLATDDFFLFVHCSLQVIDVKKFDPTVLYKAELLCDGDDQYFYLPAKTYALGMTVERFNLPVDITGIAYAKSTYARAGLEVNTTPLEAGWCGRLVIEFYNAAPLPLRLYADEGIIQVQFHKSLYKCETSYATRSGKYQDQTGMTLAKV